MTPLKHVHRTRVSSVRVYHQTPARISTEVRDFNAPFLLIRWLRTSSLNTKYIQYFNYLTQSQLNFLNICREKEDVLSLRGQLGLCFGPPAACRDVLPSTNTPTRRRLQPLRNCPLPTTPGSPGRSTSSRVVRQGSTLSLSLSTEASAARSVVRPMHSVSDYNRSGLAACDDRPGSVSRLIVRY